METVVRTIHRLVGGVLDLLQRFVRVSSSSRLMARQAWWCSSRSRREFEIQGLSSEFRDWSALPPDLLLLVAQRHLPHQDCVALAHVCKAWYTTMQKELRAQATREPLIVFWDDERRNMILYQSSKGGWSPVLESCFPPGMHHPMLSVGPWLVSWHDADLQCYNLVTQQSRSECLWGDDTAIVKAGAATIGEDMCETLICITPTAEHRWPTQIISSTVLLKKHELLLRYGTQYPCRPTALNYGAPPLHPYEESENMVILNDEKLAFFSVGDARERRKLLFWYNWESGTWGLKSLTAPSDYKFPDHGPLLFRQPFVKVMGRLGLVRCVPQHPKTYSPTLTRSRYASCIQVPKI